MSIKCLFGIHDWETLNVKSKSTLIREVKKELSGDPNYITPPTQRFPDPLYKKKICMRCHKIKDKITPAKYEIEKFYIAKRKRADMLFNIRQQIRRENE